MLAGENISGNALKRLLCFNYEQKFDQLSLIKTRCKNRGNTVYKKFVDDYFCTKKKS
jgi:hypothetical protein